MEIAAVPAFLGDCLACNLKLAVLAEPVTGPVLETHIQMAEEEGSHLIVGQVDEDAKVLLWQCPCGQSMGRSL